MIRQLIAAFAASIAFAAFAIADELPRRGSLGVVLETQEGEGGGVNVVSIQIATQTALQPGDRIISVNGAAVARAGHVGPALGRDPMPGDSVTLHIRRGGEEMDVPVTLVEAPVPQLNGVPVELGSVRSAKGDLLRTYLVRPANDNLVRDGKAPAVMLVQGINCAPAETFSNPGHPYTRVYQVMSDAGFAVYAVEKPGLADSQGDDCTRIGFDEELSGFHAGARALGETSGIDADRLYIVGISMGGLQAPLIAQQANIAGIVTWGTVLMPWYDYMIASFRRRAALEGADPVENEKLMRAWRLVLAEAFVLGKSRDEIAAAHPEAYALVTESYGDLDAFGGRSLQFSIETDRANCFAAWNSYRGRALLLHGGFDWVAEGYDHELAAIVMNRNVPGSATFEVVPGLDHIMVRHESLADSFAKFGQGPIDDAAYVRMRDWLVAEASR
ncbi:MAG TPA: PDZ domain-containing protein [Micropepsaceae bacterium]|nr:PDZ domain-containing protein [Micropepsaceae bacterium]